jgi:hypothetical protein
MRHDDAGKRKKPEQAFPSLAGLPNLAAGRESQPSHTSPVADDVMLTIRGKGSVTLSLLSLTSEPCRRSRGSVRQIKLLRTAVSNHSLGWTNRRTGMPVQGRCTVCRCLTCFEASPFPQSVMAVTGSFPSWTQLDETQSLLRPVKAGPDLPSRLPEGSSQVLVPSNPPHPASSTCSAIHSSPRPLIWLPPLLIFPLSAPRVSHLTFPPAQIISYKEAVNRAGALPDASFTRPCGSRPRRDASRTPPTLSRESSCDAVWLGWASAGNFPLHLHNRVR